MKSLFTKAGVLALVLMGSGTAVAGDFGLGVKAGTLGLGVEGVWKPLPLIDIRAGANAYDYEDTGSQAGVNYDATLNLETFYATANFKFPVSPLRVTAGVFSNGNEVNLTSLNTTSFDIGGTTYTAADVGTLTSTTSFAGTSPYFGIGYDFSLFGKVGMNLDLGVLWQGEPEVSITSDGLLATVNDQAFLNSLEAERQELQDEMKDFKAWPVVSLGFVYNF